VTDAELIRASFLNTTAFAVFCDRHYPTIHRFLHGRIGALAADDLASETFMIAFRRRKSYDLSHADGRPWLFGIAVNLLRQHRRAEERRLRAYARDADGSAPSEWLEERLDQAVAGALLDLNQDDRTLILLYAWAELSYEELAEALDLPLGTVRSRLSRTRSKLRAALAPAQTMVAAEGEQP
jgi:RNA polymerase sigma factor (sigma-70 family)